jgi:putative sterol carrier protein
LILKYLKNIFKKSEKIFGDNKISSNFALPLTKGKKDKFFENIEEGKKRVSISCQ